jgi:hypothetical protein
MEKEYTLGGREITFFCLNENRLDEQKKDRWNDQGFGPPS